MIDVRRLAPNDDRKAFASGNIELDRFFQRYAGQNQFRHHIGTTYVAVDGQGTIVGFATVSASELTAGEFAETKKGRTSPYPRLPVLRLARLAVDERVQGQGISRLLLQAVFALAHRMAEDVGCVGLVVDAKREAVAYYRKIGFVDLKAFAGELADRPLPLPLFLELEAIPKRR